MTARMTARSQRIRAEQGFTLVELLVTITILGIIMTPLSAAFVLAIRTSEASNNRIANADDAEILTVFFPPDVHAAGSEAGDVAVDADSGTTCSGIPNVVLLSGRGRETTAGTESSWSSAYAVASTGPASWRLLRAHCIDDVVTETFTVARNLASATAASATTDGRRVTLTVHGAGTSDNPEGSTVKLSATRRST